MKTTAKEWVKANGYDAPAMQKEWLHAAMEAYAKAEVEKAVAAKGKEIEKWMTAFRKIQGQVSELQHKNTWQGKDLVRLNEEITELKAANQLSSRLWRKDCEERDDMIYELKAENKRMRDGIQNEIDFQESQKDPTNFGELKSFTIRSLVVRWLSSLLFPADEPKPLDSPAPVTESPCRMCLRIKSTIEGYCGVCDRYFSPSGGE